MVIGSLHRENTKELNICFKIHEAKTDRISSQKQTNPVKAGDSSTLLSKNGRTGRQKTAKTTNQLDIDRILQPSKYTFFLSEHRTFSKIGHILGLFFKVLINLKGFKSYKVCSLISEIKLETNKRCLENSQAFGN